MRTFGYSRQAFYKRQQLEVEREDEDQEILHAVEKIRCRQPRVGGRKLQRHLGQEGIIVGRDRLLELLRQNDLLIRRRRNYKRTTQSKHRFKTYRNKIKTLKVNRPNQVYVSDITYIKVAAIYYYLFLVTDLFSRKIVGYDLHSNLTTDGAVHAMRMALAQRRDEPDLTTIHHSDRGLQYCSNEYIELLENGQIDISMTEDNHVYENALAERINGILKTEFLLDRQPSIEVAKVAVKQSIEIYNKERLHMSLNYRTPEEVHNSDMLTHDLNKERGSKRILDVKNLSHYN